MAGETKVLNCRRCGGAGRLHPLGEDGKPDYSCLVLCPDCAEGRRGERARDLLEKDPGDRTFENFIEVPENREALGAARAFAEEEGLRWLLIWGFTGNGKTHLCRAVCRTLRARGVAPIYWDTRELIVELRSLMGGGDRLREFYQRLQQAPVLILDDLFWGTEWEAGELQNIVNMRYNARKPFLATTNLDFKGCPERLRSRFSDSFSRVVHNRAPDFRRHRDFYQKAGP